MHAHAHVDPGSKGEMAAGIFAVKVKNMRLREDRFVPICRGIEHHHPLPFGDLLAADLNLF